MNISGAFLTYLGASGSSVVDISGGSFTRLGAYASSVLAFHGQNFRVGGGLIFDGNLVLGTGILSGEWFDGTPWAVNIQTHDPTSTILAVPIPAPGAFLLGSIGLSFSGWLLRRRRASH